MKLKELRKHNNKTQKEVAEFLKLSTVGYNGYETGKREPSIETLCKLADYYNVPLDYLVGRVFINELDYLSPTDREIMKLVSKLNEDNKQKLETFINGMLAVQEEK